MNTTSTVLLQHADQASFLWTLRHEAVSAPHYSLPDLAKLDSRVEAHLDGLRIAEDTGWDVCEEQLAAKEAGEVFAASVLAFEAGGRSVSTKWWQWCKSSRISRVAWFLPWAGCPPNTPSLASWP